MRFRLSRTDGTQAEQITIDTNAEKTSIPLGRLIRVAHTHTQPNTFRKELQPFPTQLKSQHQRFDSALIVKRNT